MIQTRALILHLYINEMAEEPRRGNKVRARDVFEAYFLKHHQEDIKNILEMEDEDQHYSVYINFLSLFEDHVEVAESLLASPIKLLPVLDNGLIRAAKRLLEDLEDQHLYTSKIHLHARLIGLPSCPELYSQSVPRTSDVGRLLCVVGTAVRTTAAKMLEYKKEFLCTKCKHVFNVFADHNQYYTLNKPSRCPNPDQCYGVNFAPMGMSSNPVHSKDYQEIKIQEQVQKMEIGTIPQSIWITLEDDLVESCKPGDDIIVCGTVLQRWRPVYKDSRPDIEMVIKANNITIRNKQRAGAIITDEMREKFRDFWETHKFDPLSGRNLILASFCPQVYGLYVVKMAVAIVVSGGVQKVTAGSTRIRGESHILLVGDPGTGKSQFLKYVNTLVPRCVLTTGIGTTNAGLTVSAVRDGGEWALEAGALVLADGGVCCIDEFNSVREADRAAIHEAMEQQTISVAKAGLVCKLNSRCSILAATNPKGQYDPDESLTVNVALASPLLSRFDLILVLLDTKNQDWDKIVSDYILEGKDPLGGDGGSKDDWDIEQLRLYFCHVRSMSPVMTAQANTILTKYYQIQRQTDQRSQARTTIRLLESLVRLSQGHARLMMHSEVMASDAVVAVTLMEASMCGASLISGINPLHTAFPHSPRQEYKNQAKVVLQKLGLRDILDEEMERLNEEEMNHNHAIVTNTSPKRSDPPDDSGAGATIVADHSGAGQATFHPSSRTSKNMFRPDLATQQRTVTQIEELEETTNKNLIMESFLKKKENRKKSNNKTCIAKEKLGLTGNVSPVKAVESSVESANIQGDKSKKVECSFESTVIHEDHNDSVFGPALDITFSTIVQEPVKNKKQKGTKRKSQTKITDILKRQKMTDNTNENNDINVEFDESFQKFNSIVKVSKNNLQKPPTSNFKINTSQNPSTSKFNLDKKSIGDFPSNSSNMENVKKDKEVDSSRNSPCPEKENVNNLIINSSEQSLLNKSLNNKSMLKSDKNNTKFRPKFVTKGTNKNNNNLNNEVSNKATVDKCIENSSTWASQVDVDTNDEDPVSLTKIAKTPSPSIAEKLKKYKFGLDNNKEESKIVMNNDSISLIPRKEALSHNISSKINLGNSKDHEKEIGIKSTPKSASNFTDKKIKLSFKTPVFGSSQSSASSQSPNLTSVINKFAINNQDFDDVDFDI